MKDKEFKIDVKLNKSYTYFLPYVDLQVKFEFLNQIKNSYLSYEKGDDVFCVLYEWSSDPKFTAFEGRMMNHVLFSEHVDYGKKVLYKFKLTRNMREARILFIHGKYSLFTVEHKNSIQSFLRRRGFSNVDRIKRILQRDKDLRKQMDIKLRVKIDKNSELSSRPDQEKETFLEHLTVINRKIETFHESS